MVKQLGRQAVPVEMNVTSEADVKRTIETALANFGRLDILVNNAGTNWSQSVVDFDPKRWELGLKVNALGPFLCSKYALPHLIKQRRGHILNISSIRAVQFAPASSAYAASKAALEALTGSLAMEVYKNGVCVNALRVEGTVETPGTTMLLKLKRTMWPAEVIGEAAAFVINQPFPYTGHIRTISDLRPFVPRIDELLASVGY